MPQPQSADLLRHRTFLLYFSGRLFSNFSRQIVAVAVGWQVYLLTNSAFHLGMIGLVQFVPALLLTFHGGHVADRHERKRIVQLCQWAEGIAASYLAWRSFTGAITVFDIYLAAAVFGAAAAYERPAGAAMLPNLVPPTLLQQATAMAAGSLQVATIGGPALGGFLFAYSAGITYAVIAAFWLLAGILNGALPAQHVETKHEAPTLRTLFAGVHFVRGNPTVLGTISLDLFAVLLGGATALLPIYAKDILHTSAWGLGVLRAAPAIGALVTTYFLARRPLSRRVGMRMFQAVIVFGVATVVFGLSRDIWLTLGSLIVMGAADQVSVVIRLSLVQLATPDDMRGRVSAINFLFVNASNQLGEFESGLTASWWGAVPATIIGGAGSVLIALLWMRLFPTLRDVEKLA
ncbi:MAG TPA: MFS transporter [Steroidobacteraceae bacterium]|nr:MFS transporter [Steroidobacteraceae bacterium]